MLTPKSIKVRWDPILTKEVTGYLIRYVTLAVYTRGNDVTVSGHNISEVILKYLEEDTLYNITVRSISNNKFSKPSNAISAITWIASKCIHV